MDSIYKGDMSFESKKWPIIGQVALAPNHIILSKGECGDPGGCFTNIHLSDRVFSKFSWGSCMPRPDCGSWGDAE